jgi:hypothetical protein
LRYALQSRIPTGLKQERQETKVSVSKIKDVDLWFEFRNRRHQVPRTAIAVSRCGGTGMIASAAARHLQSAPGSAFMHNGNGLNMIYVDPEHDLVAVVRWIDNDVVDGFLKRLIAAVAEKS